jgi:hypothetical protein
MEAELVPLGQPPAVALTPIVPSELVELLWLFVQTRGLLLEVAKAAGAKKENDARTITIAATAIFLPSIVPFSQGENIYLTFA